MNGMIESLAPRPVVTATPDEDVQSVARKMRDGHVGCVVVVEGRRPVGIVTDRDLTLRVLAEYPSGRAALASIPVAQVMTIDPATLPEGSGVDAALRAMRSAGTRRLPVVDPDGHLVGIVSHDDLLIVFARELGELGEGIESAVDAPELR